MSARPNETLSRGELARAAGVGSETVRFYERQGLLPRPPRSAAGYRRFDPQTVQRLHFIRRAKNLGFSLQEIRELLTLHDDDLGDRAEVKALAERKLAEIVARLHDLQRMHQVLSELSARCSGHGPLAGCPIVDALSEGALNGMPLSADPPADSSVAAHDGIVRGHSRTTT